MKRLRTVRYMMATRATHMLGDISRKSPSLCVIHGEEGKNWVGRFLAGYGFEDVRFPKRTTRGLTRKEKREYNGAVFGGEESTHTVMIPGFGVPKRAIMVETRNSTYHFGSAGKSGERTITREGRLLPFPTVKMIVFLKVGRSMVFELPDGQQLETSPVLCVGPVRRGRTNRNRVVLT